MKLGIFRNFSLPMNVVISAAIILQVSILIGMVAVAALPLLTGTDITVRTQPIDPRDLFRGNYARLGYDFSRIDANRLTTPGPLRTGEVVYVQLQQGGSGHYEFDSLTREKPESGVFLRGRIEEMFSDQVSVTYGIEAFFAPKAEAIALEQRLRERAFAVLAVSADGRARIRSVQAGI